MSKWKQNRAYVGHYVWQLAHIVHGHHTETQNIPVRDQHIHTYIQSIISYKTL